MGRMLTRHTVVLTVLQDEGRGGITGVRITIVIFINQLCGYISSRLTFINQLVIYISLTTFYISNMIYHRTIN